MAGHLDACLGCMACVTACPSGVRYDRLIEAGPGRGGARAPPPARRAGYRELVFRLFPYPRRLRALRGPLRLTEGLRRRLAPVLELLAPRLGTMAAIAPPITPRVRLPRLVRARGPRRARVGLLTGCVQDAFFPG